MYEEWRDIPGHEGQYQASSEGRIRSTRVLKARIAAQTGYPVVTLTDQERIAVHVLVARTFVGPRPLGMQVNHKDCDKRNSRPENLEYVTPSGNIQHEFRVGNRKLYFTNEQMDQIADWFFVEQCSQTDIAKRFLPKKFAIQKLRGMRKRVRSVIEIWRASRRPPQMRNRYERNLDIEKARKIRALYAAGNITQGQIAKIFDVHPAHISRVIAGQMWKEEEASCASE